MVLLKRQIAAALFMVACLVLQEAHAGIAFVVTAPHTAPPPIRQEHPGASPFKDAVWVDGRWDWRGGQYVWVTGHWDRAPDGHHRWQRGEWSERNGSWFFKAGRWL